MVGDKQLTPDRDYGLRRRRQERHRFTLYASIQMSTILCRICELTEQVGRLPRHVRNPYTRGHPSRQSLTRAQLRPDK